MNIELLGQNIYYEVHGQGKDILLLPGWGANINTYRQFINTFSDRFKITAIDLPGFGKSSLLLRPWSIGDFSDLVSQLINALKIKTPIIVGHSQGGRVAIHSIAEKGIACHKLILIDSAGVRIKPKLNKRILVYAFKTIKFFLSLGLFKGKAQPLLEKARRHFGSDDYKNASGSLRETLVHLVNQDLTGIMPKINVSTLLIWGENDQDTPLSAGKLMNKLIPDSGLVVLKDAGHFSYLDKQSEFNIIVSEFLRKDMCQ